LLPLNFVNTLEFVDIYKAFDFENDENGNNVNDINGFDWGMDFRTGFDAEKVWILDSWVSNIGISRNGSGLGFQNFVGSRISELGKGLDFADSVCYGLDFALGEEYGVFC